MVNSLQYMKNMIFLFKPQKCESLYCAPAIIINMQINSYTVKYTANTFSHYNGKLFAFFIHGVSRPQNSGPHTLNVSKRTITSIQKSDSFKCHLNFLCPMNIKMIIYDTCSTCICIANIMTNKE